MTALAADVGITGSANAYCETSIVRGLVLFEKPLEDPVMSGVSIVVEVPVECSCLGSGLFLPSAVTLHH